MTIPKTPQELLFEMQRLSEDVRTISERTRRLHDAARQIIVSTKPTLRPIEPVRT